MVLIQDILFINHLNNFNMKILKYIYYRLVKFYNKVFGIKESPGFLIQSCYSWGLLILLNAICFYLLSIETVLLGLYGFKMNEVLLLITFLPFVLIHVFSEELFGDGRERFKELCQRYQKDKYAVIKGIIVFVFVTFSIPCFIITLFHYH